MSKKFRAVLAATGAAVLMATGFAGAASAAPTGTAESWDDCARGHVCLWDKPGFNGTKILEWRPRHRGGELYDFPAPAADRAESIRNNTDFHVRLYNLHNAMGFGHHCFPAWSSYGDLNQLGLGNSVRSATTAYQC